MKSKYQQRRENSLLIYKKNRKQRVDLLLISGVTSPELVLLPFINSLEMIKTPLMLRGFELPFLVTQTLWVHIANGVWKINLCNRLQ